MTDIAKIVQSWIPDGDGYNSEYALQMQDVIAGIDELRTQLDQALKQNKAHYEMGRGQQAIQDAEKLAACQARNVELREALSAMQEYAKERNCGLRICDEALSRTTETEALDAAIAKAVEDCVKAFKSSYPMLQSMDEIADAIRARGKP